MSPVSRRSSAAPLMLLAAVAALTLTGCFAPPPLPTSAPADPTPIEDPAETSEAPSPQPTTSAPTAAPAGDIPELVAIGTELPPGTLGGWETSLLSTDGFEPQDDSTFPIGPTISVIETATGCSFWAYQGTQDSESTDEAENSAVSLGILSSSSPDDWEPDVFTLDPSSQGAAVEMLSIIQEREDGSAEAWFARNFQSGGMTSSIMAACPAGGGGVDHIDEVVREHLQINFLLP